MFKNLLRIYFIVIMWELGKWLGKKIFLRLSSNGNEDNAPKDYASPQDQRDINEVTH